MGKRNKNHGDPTEADHVVVGQNDPRTDPHDVQQAINQAYLAGGGVVQLIGTFDFGDRNFCVIVPGPVTVTGRADPSGVIPPPESTTMIKSTGTAPLVIWDTGDADGEITIKNLWFNGAQTMAVYFREITGTVTMIDNRVSGVVPGRAMRFAMAGAKINGVGQDDENEASDQGKLTGNVILESNYIDNDMPFDKGDDNGFAFAGASLAEVRVIDNFIRAGEAVEIEGCFGTEAVYTIEGNHIVQTPVISILAQETNAPDFARHGGHPAAIKPLGVEASQVIVRGNTIDAREAYWTAVCIMTGNSNPDGRTIIEDNHCLMNNQFAGILGGWAGAPGFFPPSYMQHTIVRNNRFAGNALLGAAWLDFSYLNIPDMGVVNEANNNLVTDNDFGDFRPTRATMYLGPHTHDNELKGPFLGPVEDQGTDNHITRR